MKPAILSSPSLITRILISSFCIWIASCALLEEEMSYDLVVTVKTLPYSMIVLPFEYSSSDGAETFKEFHLDSTIGQELQRWKFFKNVYFPDHSPSTVRTTLSRFGDLTLRGEIIKFQASCVPALPEKSGSEEKVEAAKEEEGETPRNEWIKEQETGNGFSKPEMDSQKWEWGEKFSEFEAPDKDRGSPRLSDDSDPFSAELVKNNVQGKLAFVIRIYGKRTNEKIFENIYEDEFSETVTAFTATPETVDDYVTKVLLSRMLKEFLEDLAIDFYQYTETRDFILKTDLLPPREWPTTYDDLH